MEQRFPGWLIGVLIAQLLIAGLFLLFAWDMTRSFAQGRAVNPLDLALLCSPLAAVVLLGAVSFGLWDRDRRQAAIACALLPFPLALALFRAVGAF